MKAMDMQKILSLNSLISFAVSLIIGIGTISAEAEKIETKDFWAISSKGNLVMTSVFGEIANNTGRDVRLLAAKSDASSITQLFQTINGSSQENKTGFLIKKDTTFQFKPNGNSIRLMGLNKDLKPGDSIGIALYFSDDTVFNTKATVKEYLGAFKEYNK